MIRIGVDGNEANVEKKVGVSVYTLNLLRYFSKVADQEHCFIVYLKYTPSLELPEENKYFKYKVIKGNFLWSQIYLPIYLSTHREIDVYFSPAHYLPSFCPVPQVVTIHDLAYQYFPNDFTKKDLWQLKNWTKMSVKKANKIIAVSKTTKKDIIKIYNVDETKVTVIYNGYEKTTKEKTSAVEGRSGKTAEVKLKKYILFVGTIQPRKNLSVLIDAFNKFLEQNKNFKLVIVGKKGWLYDDIFKKVRTLKLEDKIIFTDHITDEELVWYYQNAFCFVLPSLYEGFGIPILEAMSNNCPTIISMNSSLPEVGGEASLYFDPSNPDDLLEKLNMILNNKNLKKELISKGNLRIKDFSWEKCAQQTLDILRSVLIKGRTFYKESPL